MSNEALPNDTVNKQTSTVSDTKDEIEIDVSNTSTKQTSSSTTLDCEKPTKSTGDDLFTINDFEVPITKKSSNNVSSDVDSKRTSRSPEYDLGGPSTLTANNFGDPSTSTAINFGDPSTSTANNFENSSTSTANNFEDPSTSKANNFEGPSTSTANDLLPELELKDRSTSTVITFSDDTESNGSHSQTERSPLLNPPVVDGNGRNRHLCRDACNALFLTILNFAMVIIGALSIHKCEVLKLAPICLVIAGVMVIILKSLAIFCQRSFGRVAVFYIGAISLIETAWLIYISYWVYSAKPDFDPANPSYCNKEAYYLTFWMVTTYWIIVGVLMSCFCCSLCVAIPVAVYMKRVK